MRLPAQAGFEVLGLSEGKQGPWSVAQVADSYTNEMTTVCAQEHQGGEGPQGEKRPL